MMSRHKYYGTPRQILIALKRCPQTAIKDLRQEGSVALDCSSIEISFLNATFSSLSAFLPLFSHRQRDNCIKIHEWYSLFSLDTYARLLNGLSDTRYVQY